MTGTVLCDDYDAALFDLDGVVYLGPDPVEGAPDGIAGLRARGIQVGFVTNNAARPPRTVAEQLTRIGVPAGPQDVVTSAQAVAAMLREALDPGSPVLVVGTDALAEEVQAVGLLPVADRHADPLAVVQGYDPKMSWPRVTDAVHAIQAGARWFASNLDSTRPTDLGLEPGVGTQVAAVGSCFPGREPEVAGKPFPPLLRETVRRLGGNHPIFVGDRLDTDIEGAHRAGMDSLFVFTGAHGVRDLLDAVPNRRPSYIGHDLRALLAPSRKAGLSGEEASCGRARAWLDHDQVRLEGPVGTLDEQLDALWAVLALNWAVRDAGDRAPELGTAVEALSLVH
ncbi:Haloacid Dehalogenase Superfamily Class (subfamily) IIA [Propionibacterium cyclohexanicum]|uniref:Haloacid Dehalogenase Superfamily Class (Subfamily) IIA n=1 Tax=Propionibacterium cyclohexanicum TaxID=64702 RepID=A0A1H9QVB1_9ACTN|nr:HAD-IIA family hydrolase [Propionibacterium cyclohexanicum]SER64175.1 Haloacid Dehalogenase Superfamily Class (subfamily) IIA [Propionibacterium cyclohexanicum]